MAKAVTKDKKTPAEEKVESKNQEKQAFKTSPSVLDHGTATPYIALFDAALEPIMNPLTGVALGAYVSQFQYRFDQEHENECVMTVDTGNPDTVDIPEIQDGAPVSIQYGYIYPDGTIYSSKVHELEVKELESTFDDQGTHLVIHLKDSTSNLRSTDPYKPLGDSYTFTQFMDNGMNQNVGIVIEMFEPIEVNNNESSTNK